MKIRLFTIPNIITLCNLLCGSIAATTALSGGDLRIAFWFVVAAAICDFLDGMTARLLNSYSGIGVELDSLADMVSFGFAPAAIMYAVYSGSLPHFELSSEIMTVGAYTPFLITAFSALRLAKFNVDKSQESEFSGLPTPASALFFASLGWLVANQNLELGREIIIALSIIFALLLIVNLRMFSFKFKSLKWSDNALRYIFAIVTVALLVWLKVGAIPLVILLYIVTSAIRATTNRGSKMNVTE